MVVPTMRITIFGGLFWGLFWDTTKLGASHETVIGNYGTPSFGGQ